MKHAVKLTLSGVLLGFILTLTIQRVIFPQSNVDSPAEPSEEPLYWVAPMDPNFRRDQPGLSPMGMDLIPVYASELNSDHASKGEIKINPVVVNNIGIKTATAQIGTIKNTINTVGVVQFDENKLVHIHPRVEGWIDKLYVKSMGERVAAGDVLYEIYSLELVNAQEEYILALRNKSASLIRASEARLKALHIPAYIIKAVKNELKSRHTIPIHSPQDGVVEHLAIREGYYVKPGTTLMSIANLESVWIEAQILTYHQANLIVGSSATMHTKSQRNQIWHGKVEYIYPSLDRNNKTLRARLIVANETRQLQPNMFVDIKIEQPDVKALVIPKSALIRSTTNDRVVIKTSDETYKSIMVTPGIFDDSHVQITSGLLPGDVVVTSAQFLLDSESSKASDFDRMSLSDMDNVAFTTGVINTIDAERRVLNISRTAIEKWNRPAATMDFQVPDRVDINQFITGQNIQFYFRVDAGELIILYAQVIAAGSSNS